MLHVKYIFMIKKENLANKFNIKIDFLPDIAAYFPQTEIYSPYNGKYNLEGITKFMDTFLKWETTLTKLKLEDINFKDVKCEDIREEKKSEEVDGNIIILISEIEIKLDEENIIKEENSGTKDEI